MLTNSKVEKFPLQMLRGFGSILTFYATTALLKILRLHDKNECGKLMKRINVQMEEFVQTTFAVNAKIIIFNDEIKI